MQPHHRTSLECDLVIGLDCEDIGGRAGPLVLLVVVGLGDHLYLRGHKEGGVEADTELSDEVEFACLETF